MTATPFIPDTAPFSPEQRAWLNGFFAGMFSRGSSPDPRPQAPSPSSAVALQPLTILFGSQTGTAEGLAKRVAKEAGKRAFAATILDMAQCDLAQLAGEKNLLVLTSTYGDGEPPDNAKALHTALASAIGSSLASAPSSALNSQPSTLSSLRFSVLALGDTNYTQFCKAGADFDLYLEKLGATRVAPRADCDLDYEEKFTAWLNAALTALTALASPLAGASSLATSPAEVATKSLPPQTNPSPATPRRIRSPPYSSPPATSAARPPPSRSTTSSSISPAPAWPTRLATPSASSRTIAPRTSPMCSPPSAATARKPCPRPTPAPFRSVVRSPSSTISASLRLIC